MRINWLPVTAPFLALFGCATGGFEHVLQLANLQQLDGVWEAFEDLPAEVAAGSVQEKMAYLRGRVEDAAGPLL